MMGGKIPRNCLPRQRGVLGPSIFQCTYGASRNCIFLIRLVETGSLNDVN